LAYSASNEHGAITATTAAAANDDDDDDDEVNDMYLGQEGVFCSR